ncbi:alpha/beta hydrolase domain-containing protein [Pseudomonas sp. NPDC008258]|uniref:alpha/beta hydrolase domain-containing protein n=1 Tax=Pseudomonas sp. NPDC008258 TaxID=3364418 RepID=UPI0036E2B33A
MLDSVRRDADGLIEVETDLCLLLPEEEQATTQLTVVANIVNRGGWIGPLADFSQGPQVLQCDESAIANGAGFMASRGMATVWCGWQGDIAPDPELILARLPRAQDVRGWVHEEIIPDTAIGGTSNAREAGYVIAELAYPILDLAKCRLSVRQQADEPAVALDTNCLTVLDSHRVRIRLAPQADAGAIYRLEYLSTDPIVSGLGFGVVREVFDFLKQCPCDQRGNPNPLWQAGRAVTLVAKGYSQGARFLREFLHLGFNQATAGSRLFDAMLIIAGGARVTKANQPFWRVSRFSRQHEDSDAPDLAFPFTYGLSAEPWSGQRDSLLRRCEAQGCTPKIMQLETDSETWHGRLSLLATDGQGHGIDLPEMVRLYFVAGQHVVGSPASFGVEDICQAPTNPIDWGCYARALLVALVEWVTREVTPPASRFPSLTEGSLVPLERAEQVYPRFSGLPYDATMAPARIVMDEDQVREYPVLVPCPDSNGNPMGGIPMPELVVPVATYSGRNRRLVGHGAPGLALIWGSCEPFADSRVQRLATGDSRLSLEERYSSPEHFMKLWRQAVETLVTGRLLLEADSAQVISQGERLARTVSSIQEPTNGQH